MGKTIAVFSRKGGVGKTITAVNLAGAFALSGRRTLLMDCDPQGSAALCAGRFALRPDKRVSDFIAGVKEPHEIVAESCISGLKVISPPDELFLCNHENLFTKEKRGILRDLAARLEESFDYILIDTGPDISPFTMCALCAADRVLVPLQCEFLAFKNLGATIKTLRSAKENFNHRLRLLGILLTMADSGGIAAHRIKASAGNHLKSKLFKTAIPRSGSLRDSPGFRKPAVLRAPETDGARSYIALANEISAMDSKLHH
jgi:chromosome partitioning protein